MFFINLLFICFSILCSILLFRLFLHRTALIHVVRQWAEWLDDRVHLHQHIKVPELNDSTQQENNLYRKVSLYINSLPSLENSDYINLFSSKERNDIVLLPEDDQVIPDSFLGARVSWIHKIAGTNSDSSKSFVLRIKKKDKRRILKPYLQHVHTVSDEIKETRKGLRIFNHSSGKWKSVPFNHPASFDSLVMDLELKNKIKNELEAFLKSKQYYQKLGRVWKRSYLLYGPSGTGKSSFIAAIANYLNYDVYNVNLSQVNDDGDLNALLIRASRKSLMVVEDLDRYESAITQSGLMNFMDGILNFEEERIMIFTTNTKDGIDQAILRPGRIDVHIYFPNCDFNSFKNLATNYLGVKEHKLFPQVEEIFMSGATLSPAEISELMLVNRNSPSRALKSVISALRNGSNKVVVSRLSDSVASSPAQVSVTEESGGAAWKEAVPVKELRKLYGLLRLKSCRSPGSLDHDSRMVERGKMI